MSDNELNDILLPATCLVRDAVLGKLTIPAFIERYGSFFHYNALDGHEATAAEEQQTLAHYAEHCQFHEAVQSRVVDLFYAGPAQQVYDHAGRLNAGAALEALRELAQQHELDRLIEDLEKRREIP